MLTRKHANLVLAFLAVLLALSYFYEVPQNPPGFYIDESSIAYNAYTIAKSGQDEYGESWPLYFRAFGEYKNPVFIYLLAFFFRIFGPSIFIARLLSAGLTVIAVGLLWLLAYKVSQRKIVASLVAISALLTPWLFGNSRLVFEVALYPTLLVLFLIVVKRASEQQKWNVLEPLALAITLALLTYSASIGRLFAPLLALGLVFFASRQRWPGLLATWALYGLTLIPAIIFNFQNPNVLLHRFWLLTYLSPEKSVPQLVMTFCQQYLLNLNPWTMAVTGEINVRDHVGSMGSVLLPSLLLAAAGIIRVIRRSRSESWWRFMLYALVISPIPASLTTTEFPQIRLIALPVLLHIFMIPPLSFLTDVAASRKAAQIVLASLLLCVMVQGVVYRMQFSKAGPERWYIFDEQFPREVFPTALAQDKYPIYFYDPPGKSGYVQLYWYGVLLGLPAETFVRLPHDAKPPDGAVVLSTAEECSDCRLLLKSINYIVYIAGEVTTPEQIQAP
jgi:Dolichyl-phosphate-mannose-protein mannosyltransferase